MTAVDLPDEPPVGTTLTAPEARHLWVRHDDGWRVTTISGDRPAPAAPPGRWASVVWNLTELGGILTVTTEYQIAYRFFDPTTDDEADRELGEVTLIGGFLSREHVTRWAASMQGANAVEILRVQSQRVTRSAWTDEPIEDPT